jgi:alpha-tubulin suppressor-like RCC1 family protein
MTFKSASRLCLGSALLLSACSSDGPAAEGPSSTDPHVLAVAAQTITSQMVLPSGLGTAGFLVAQNKVQLDTGVSVPAAIWSAGSMSMQPDAKAQSVTCTGNVVLADRDTVSSLTLGGTLTKGNSNVIGTLVRTQLSNVTSSSSVTFPAASQTVTLNSGQSQTLNPGSYVSVTVNSGATLTLLAGDYYVGSLTLQSSSVLKLNPTQGATRIFIASGFAYRPTLAAGADASRFFVEYLGTTPVVLETPFAGSIVAPRASLAIGTANSKTHRGSFMAQSIEVQPYAKLEFVKLNGAGTTSSCAAGTWDPDGNPFTPCVAKTVCAAGTYVSSEGTTTSDRACTGCASGQFSTATNAPSCTAWTTCVPGTYVANVPSSTTDRSCLACPSGQFSSGNNQSQCLAQGSCPAGTVQTAAGSATSAAVCTPCVAGQFCAGGTSPQIACPDGTWDNDSDPATACVDKTTCVAGTYVTSPGSTTSDRTCASCASGTFSTEANTAVCTAWTLCGPGSFVTNTPSATVDRTCSPCPAGQFSSSNNQSSCQAQGSCGAGSVETAAGTPTSPAICQTCQPGNYCAGGTNPPAACPAGTWDQDGSAASPCVAKTDCVPGSFVATEGGALVDRVCASCGSGEFSTSNNAASCTPWSSCAPGTFVSNTPSATANRVCADCPSGSFSAGSNAGSCALWNNCSAGTYVSNTPSATADRICTACPSGQTSSGQNATSCVAVTDSTDSIAIGSQHTCAIVAGGVQCWGFNWYGELGDGTTGLYRAVPAPVSGLGSGVTAISAGGSHTCALVGGGVKCWGRNQYGQLGDNSTIDESSPVWVSGLGVGSGVTAIAASGDNTCALVSGALKCWGDNQYGQLGDDSIAEKHVPTLVTGLGSGVTAISAGGMHTCAVAAGKGFCWGDNRWGELGDGSLTDQRVPVQVSGLTSGVTAVIAGYYHTCALVNGGVQCWGNNDYGQLGDGTAVWGRFVPGPVTGLGAGSGVTAVVAGPTQTFAVVAGGMKAWGWNEQIGMLGDGSLTNQSTPVSVFANGVSTVAANAVHACAWVSGLLQCWGRNDWGQLGDGTVSSTPRIIPAPVVFP